MSKTEQETDVNPSVPVWVIPQQAAIICAGLACVDMQLNNATGGDGGEDIETFEGETSVGGGSVSMACKTLAKLCRGQSAPGFESSAAALVTTPMVHRIVPLCKVGKDDTGSKLISLLQKSGQACGNVDTSIMEQASEIDTNARTALAVLPIYRDGRRGCFFDAASNTTFSPADMIEMLGALPDKQRHSAFLFGYPHLLPMMQGQRLVEIITAARKRLLDGGVVALDLNGVSPPAEEEMQMQDGLRNVESLKKDKIIGQALQHTDLLHMNHDELQILTGCKLQGTDDAESKDEELIVKASNLFLKCGVAVIAVTRGKKGSYIACNDAARLGASPALPTTWAGCCTMMPASLLPADTAINSNGAGDSFTSALLLASLLRRRGVDKDDDASRGECLTLDVAARFAGLVAAHHVNIRTRHDTCVAVEPMIEEASREQ